jgi:hypothetical protein
MPPEDRFVVGPSLWKLLKLVSISVLFVLLGLAFVTRPEVFDVADIGLMTVVGWASIAFFGLGIPIFAVQLIQRKPEFIIDRTGITYPKWSEAAIKWSEIAAVGTSDVARTKFVTLRLADPDQLRTDLPKTMMTKLNRQLTGGELSIPLSSADKSLAEVMAAVERYRPAT